MKEFVPGQVVRLVSDNIASARSFNTVYSYFDMWGWLATPGLHVDSIVTLIERSDHPSNVCMFMAMTEYGIRFISTKNLEALDKL